MKTKSYFGLAAALIVLLATVVSAGVPRTRRRPAAQSPYVPVTEYDAGRDAAEDIANALKEAQRTNRNVLVEVGGQWCSWCHKLDGFFKANPDLTRLRDQNFVTVKINYSDENENKQVLSRYPPIGGYPHMFFLDARGRLLHSQDTGMLEKGPSYDLERLTAVLTNWGPKK